MTPNTTLHPAFGKLLCVAADATVGCLLVALLRTRVKHDTTVCAAVALYLFNPFTAAVATRGSADAAVCACVLAVLYAIHHGRYAAAGLLYGFAVHLKLYPVVYAAPLALHVLRGDRRWPRLAALVSAAAAGFVVPFAVFYTMYGADFVRNTYTYHASRVDFRHNFSPYFYGVYLAYGSRLGSWLPLVATAPQVAVVIGVGAACCSDLPFAFALQTVAFVAFNRVSTAQYFVWYIALVPLAVAGRQWPTRAAVIWAVCEVCWLATAYCLEFLGARAFALVWGASMVFFGAHIWLLRCLLLAPPSKPKLS